MHESVSPMVDSNPVIRKESILPERRRAIGLVNCIAKSFPEEQKGALDKDTRAALLGFMIGVKPAVLMRELPDPGAVQHHLEAEGVNAFIYQNSMIVNRDAVLERVAEEPALAAEFGWAEGMTVDEWLARSNPSGNVKQRGIIGFFLGYPQSAILAYTGDGISDPKGVDIPGPYGGRLFYFATDAGLVDADDVTALAEKSRAAFERAGFGEFMPEKDGK